MEDTDKEIVNLAQDTAQFIRARSNFDFDYGYLISCIIEAIENSKK